MATSGTFTVNLGSTPATSGTFTLAMQPGARVMLLSQAAGPYPGKGTLSDEAQMDTVWVSTVTSGRNLICHWTSSGAVVGAFRFNWVAV